MADGQQFVAPVYTDELTESDIQGLVDRFTEVGFEMTGADEGITEYRTEQGYDPDRKRGSLSEVSTSIVENGSGGIYLSLDGFELEINIDPERSERAAAPIRLWGLDGALFGDGVSEAAAKRRAETVVEAIVAATTETDPWGVVGTFLDEGHLVGEFPSDPPPEATLSRLSWLTVFGPEWCDQLGGRERLLETPAWSTRELSNGAVLVRKNEVPDPEWKANSVLSEKKVVAPTDYVFEGWTTTDPDQLREQERLKGNRETLDPFRSFEEGGCGNDILMCKSHAPIEIDGIDYGSLLDNDLTIGDRCQVLKVQRRENELRVAESGEFVRRLVDDDGVPIGDRPDDVPPEHEMLSLTILLEDQRENPPSWYSIDGMDDKSICARLNSFLVLSRSDSSIWQEG